MRCRLGGVALRPCVRQYETCRLYAARLPLTWCVHLSGRALELGRELLHKWGYKRVDELIWVKTNSLRRLIVSGRTGHWLNHSKEHCLVGYKGRPVINRWGLRNVVGLHVSL